LLEKYYGIHEPLKKAKETYKLIAKYQKLAGSQPQPWDSKRITEFIAKAAEEYGNSKWAELFKKDIYGAAEEWWNRFYKKIEELLTQ